MATSTALVFQSTRFDVIDRNKQPWLRGRQIAAALGYERPRDLIDLYNRNAVEFTDSMTALVKLPTAGGLQESRIFSLRGAHLLGMFARTGNAATFRRWVLDILDREAAVPPAPTFAPQPAVDHYELYQEATALLCKLGGMHGRGAAITMLAQFDARTLPHVARERLLEFIAACKKVLGATANPAPAAPALTPQQVEEITQRLDSLTRLFHPHSQPFADVMGIARALRGLDPKLGARAPAFVPLLPDAVPVVETPLRQQVVQTLRALYSHGDYKALARDLGIHESSAKKIVGRLKLGAI